MKLTRLNSLIGATFGLIYLLANAGELNSTAAWIVRAGGVAAFIGLIALIRRRASIPDDTPGPDGASPFRERGYRLVIAAEAGALVVGIALLRGPLHAPNAVIGWVSLVVGAHFAGLAKVWHTPLFNLLGAAIAACGLVGLVAAGAHASVAAIAVIAGVVPGGLLLASAYAGVLGRTTR